MTHTDLFDFINLLPKAELHLHLEGSYEPELMFTIARRNKVSLPYRSVDAITQAYRFNNLQDFLTIYYEGAKTLLYQQDFYDLTYAYFLKAKSQNILHAEIFFDPQTHTGRGVEFETVVEGIIAAQADALNNLGISSKLILCFLRHLDQASAKQTLLAALPYRQHLCAVGLDSSEKGNPPSKFTEVFDLAQKHGFITVAHAGEEGPADYIYQAIKLLHVSRIDHGNHATDDPELVDFLAANQLPLTMCPLSNQKLKVVPDLKDHPLKKLLNQGLLVTVNSDDPAYFGGYLTENYFAVATALNLPAADIGKLARNSFQASFLSPTDKQSCLDKLAAYLNNAPVFPI